jgi:hypothetical protein
MSAPEDVSLAHCLTSFVKIKRFAHRLILPNLQTLSKINKTKTNDRLNNFMVKIWTDEMRLR